MLAEIQEHRKAYLANVPLRRGTTPFVGRQHDGPCIHNAQSGSAHGQVTFGKDAGIRDHLGWRLQWFDRWLKGAENAVGRETPFATPVCIFVMGTGDGRKTADGKLNHGGSPTNSSAANVWVEHFFSRGLAGRVGGGSKTAVAPIILPALRTGWT